MRRLACVVAAVTASALVAMPAMAGSDGPTRLLARGGEYYITLSRAKVNPGPAITEFVNDGEDAHDLVIQKQGGTRLWQFPEVEPGDTAELDRRFKRKSDYVLWCTLQDGLHRYKGMEAALHVRERPR
jgi:hypothetical protein